MTAAAEHVSGATAPTADLGMALGLAGLCQESSDILGQLALRTEDPQIRQMLQTARKARQAIVEQIEMENDITQMTIENDPFIEARKCYKKLAETTAVNDPSLLDAFREADRLALQSLRSAFKEVHHLRLACQISSLMASFQVSSDSLRIEQH